MYRLLYFGVYRKSHLEVFPPVFSLRASAFSAPLRYPFLFLSAPSPQTQSQNSPRSVAQVRPRIATQQALSFQLDTHSFSSNSHLAENKRHNLDFNSSAFSRLRTPHLEAICYQIFTQIIRGVYTKREARRGCL
jgi:hypothetical protein